MLSDPKNDAQTIEFINIKIEVQHTTRYWKNK